MKTPFLYETWCDYPYTFSAYDIVLIEVSAEDSDCVDIWLRGKDAPCRIDYDDEDKAKANALRLGKQWREAVAAVEGGPA